MVEAGELLLATATQLVILLQYYIKDMKPVLIVGAPGIGKSDIVAQVARMLKCDFLIMHPVVSDPTDVKGMPFVLNGVAVWLPFGNLQMMIDAKKLLIVFLDDLGQAPPMVQASFMQLLLAREIDGQKISDYVVFVSATNDKSHMAGVSGILEPVKSRFATIVFLGVEALPWIDWATKNGVNHKMVSFIRQFPKMLMQFDPTTDIRNTPSPRTVTFGARALDYDMPKDIERIAVQGAVGEGFTVELYRYLKVYLEIPDIELAISNPRKVKMPTSMSANIAFADALGYYANDDNIKNVMKIADRFESPEFAVQMLTIAQNRDKKIRRNRPVIEWLSENQDIM